MARSDSVTLVLTAMHVAAFAQLGVLTRVYLDKFFQDGCNRGWGLCLTSPGDEMRSYGAYYTDLPSNMLGSFIMGCLATSGALGLAVNKAAALLPAGHPWQKNGALLAGLRTGYCGSLTTFSAWQLQCVLLLVGGTGRQGGQWDQALWAVVIGLQTSLASLVTGQHVALAVHRWLLPEGRKVIQPDGAHPTTVAKEFHGRRALLLAGTAQGGHTPGPGQPSKQQVAPRQLDKVGQPRQRPQAIPAADGVADGHSEGVAKGDAAGRQSAEEARRQSREEAEREMGWDEEGPAGAADEEAALEQRPFGAHPAAAAAIELQQYQHPGGQHAQQPAGVPVRKSPHGDRRQSREEARRESREEVEREMGWDEEGPAGVSDEEAAEEKASPGRPSWHRGIKTHAAMGLMLALLTALFVVLTVVDSRRSHAGRRALWLSILMGPPGALLRWLLADLNFIAPGRAAFFPFGTFIANMLACIVIFAMEVPADVTALGYWAQIVVTAIQKGFCGALSTVSTLVNEIHAMFEVYPDHFHAYVYPFISIAAAWLIGLVVYGAAAWAHM